MRPDLLWARKIRDIYKIETIKISTKSFQQFVRGSFYVVIFYTLSSCKNWKKKKRNPTIDLNIEQKKGYIAGDWSLHQGIKTRITQITQGQEEETRMDSELTEQNQKKKKM